VRSHKIKVRSSGFKNSLKILEICDFLYIILYFPFDDYHRRGLKGLEVSVSHSATRPERKQPLREEVG
jgi:hypothetical protein